MHQMCRHAFARCLRQMSSLSTPTEIRVIDRELLTWHPGHINKGRRMINNKLINVDLVVEVHDARIPVTGRARLFEDSRAARPHVLVLNKADLAPRLSLQRWRQILQEETSASVFCCSLRQPTRRLLDSLISSIVQLSGLNPRPNRSSLQTLNLLIAGIPNVGKSSLINALRAQFTGRRAAARVGSVAGITRHVGERIKICEDPSIFVLDSPGILDPECKDEIETMLKLGACGCVDLDSVDARIIVDYVLYFCNTRNNLAYVSLYDMPGPTDSVDQLLSAVCRKHKLVQQTRDFVTKRMLYGPNFSAGSRQLLRHLNQGLLGSVLFDALPDDGTDYGFLPFAYTK